MADLTYTIYNNSNDTTATINYFEIATNLSEQQHRLKIPAFWNPPFNASPYTDFTGATTLRSEVKTYTSDVGSVNHTTTATTTGTTLRLDSNSELQVGWTVFNASYIYSGQTVANKLGTQTVILSSVPDVVPFSSGVAITFTPPEFLLDVNNTTDLQEGWVASGNGYNGETILEVRSGTRLVMSDQPSTNPSPGGNITFTSDEDNMLEIPPLSSSTFVMDYDRITSVYGTYTSIVTMHATLGSNVVKNINNFMLVSALPVTNPASPFYVGEGGGGASPDPCTDNTSVSCSVSGGTGAGTCYLTTAATSYYGKDDRCLELETARALREIASVKSSKNRMFIQLYYKIAPIIVERKKQWNDVYENTLVPLVDLYKNNQHDDAIKLYKKEVAKLIAQYITPKDREIIEFTFDSLFRFKKVPYFIKVIVLRFLLWFEMTFRL